MKNYEENIINLIIKMINMIFLIISFVDFNIFCYLVSDIIIYNMNITWIRINTSYCWSRIFLPLKTTVSDTCSWNIININCDLSEKEVKIIHTLHINSRNRNIDILRNPWLFIMVMISFNSLFKIDLASKIGYKCFLSVFNQYNNELQKK